LFIQASQKTTHYYRYLGDTKMIIGNIQKAKATLYFELMKKHHELLTDTEVEIMYQLAKDPDIQQILSDASDGTIRFVKNVDEARELLNEEHGT